MSNPVPSNSLFGPNVKVAVSVPPSPSGSSRAQGHLAWIRCPEEVGVVAGADGDVGTGPGRFVVDEVDNDIAGQADVGGGDRFSAEDELASGRALPRKGRIHLVVNRGTRSNGSGESERESTRARCGCWRRDEVRRRWRHVVFLAVLVGVVGAIVLSTAAGARRTSSALARFNSSSRASDLEISVGDATPAQLRAFGQVANVAAFAPIRGGAEEFPKAPQLQAVAEAIDSRFGTVVDRARVVAGRLARPTSVDEINIGEAFAAQLHLVVGDHLDAVSYTPEQIAGFRAGDTSTVQDPQGPHIRLRIVGIVRRPLDLGDRGASGGVLVLTPAFHRKYESTIGSFSGTILRVRARHGIQDVAQIAAAARRIFRSPQFDVQDLAVDTQGAQNAIDVLSVALWVFAGVAALAGLVAITIVLSREISATTTDQTTQSALGLTRRQRIAAGGFQTLPIALGGAVIAVVGAALASQLFPIGVARPR